RFRARRRSGRAALGMAENPSTESEQLLISCPPRRRQPMPRIALAGYALFLLTAFGLRTAVHLWRTGRTGFVAPSALAGAAERLGAVLFVVALVAAGSAPALELAGIVEPVPFLDVPAVHALGILLAAAGMVLTLWAQLGMGDSWRVGVDAAERTSLVTHGLFGRVRNPIFSG